MVTCYCCGEEIDVDDAYNVEGEYVCESCYDDETFECDCCNDRIFYNNRISDYYTMICECCYENHYYRCEKCDCLVYNEDVYWRGDYAYCSECYDEIKDNFRIKSYNYKPKPIFYKRDGENAVRYYGVELEIDDGGRDDDNAGQILKTANLSDELLYAKTDSSLNDGMELVSHPCSINFQATLVR